MIHALKEVNADGSAWQNAKPDESPRWPNDADGASENSPVVVDGVKISREDRDASWTTRPNSAKRRMTVTIFDNMIRNRSRRFSYVGDRPRTSNLFATSGLVAAMYAAVCDPEYGIDADPLTIFNDRMCSVEKRKKPNERYYMFARESSRFLFDDVRMFTKEPEYDSYAVISRGEQMLIRATPRPVRPAVPENRAQSAILMDLLYGTPPPGYNLPSIAGLPAPADVASEKKRGGGRGESSGDKRDRALRTDASVLKVHTKSAAEGARNLDAMLKKRAAGRNAGLQSAAGATATPRDRLAEESKRSTRRLMGRLDTTVAVEISVTSDAIAQMAELVHKNIDFVSDLRKADREAARLMTMRKELLQEGILAPWWTGYPDLFSQVRKVVRLVRGGKYFAYDMEFMVKFCAYAAATVASHRVARPLQIYLNEYELLTGGFKDLPLLKVPERPIRFAVDYNDNDRLPRLMSPITDKYAYARAIDDKRLSHSDVPMKDAVAATWVLLDKMEKHAKKKGGTISREASSSDGEDSESDHDDGGRVGVAGKRSKTKERTDGGVTFMVSLRDDMVRNSNRWGVFACNKRTATEVDARAIVVDYETYCLWMWIVDETDYQKWREAHDNGALKIRDGRQNHDFGRWMCAFTFMLVGREYNVTDAIVRESMKKSVVKETQQLERVVLGEPSTSKEKGKTKEQKEHEAGPALHAIGQGTLTDAEIETIRDDISNAFNADLEDIGVNMYMVIETEGRRVHYASSTARGAFSNTQSFAGCAGGSKKKCAWLSDHRLRMLYDYPVRADAPIVEEEGDDELEEEVQRMHDGDVEFMGEARFSQYAMVGVQGVGHKHVNIRRVYMIYPELYKAAVQLCKADVRVVDVRRILAPLKAEGDGRRYLHVLRLLERHLKAHALEIAPLVDPGFVDRKCTPPELLYYETLLMSTYENEPMGTVTWSTRKWETINPKEGRLKTFGRLQWSRVASHNDSHVPVPQYQRTYDTNTRTMISMSLDQITDVCSARADQFVYVSNEATDNISHMMLVLWSSVVWFTVYFQWGHSTFWDAYGRYHYVLSRARRKPCDDNAVPLENLARFLADQEISAYNLVIHNFNSVRSYLIGKVYKDFTLAGTAKELMPRKDETGAFFQSLKTSVSNMIHEIWKKRHSFAPPTTHASTSRWTQLRPDYVRGELFSKLNHILTHDRIALEAHLRTRFQQELTQYHEMRALYASDPVKYSDIPEIARRIWGERATADLAAALNAGDHDMTDALYERADDVMDTTDVTEAMVRSANSVIEDIEQSINDVEMTDVSTDADALLRVLHNTNPNDVHRQHVGHVVIDTVINEMMDYETFFADGVDTDAASHATRIAESNINTAIAIVSYIANTLGITDVDEKRELYNAVLESNFDPKLVDQYVRKQFSTQLPVGDVVASVATAMAVPSQSSSQSGGDPRKDARDDGWQKRGDERGDGKKRKRKKGDGDEDDDDGDDDGASATRKLIEAELASVRHARATTHDALLKSQDKESASVLVKYSEGLHTMETTLLQQLIAEQARAGLVAAPPNIAATTAGAGVSASADDGTRRQTVQTDEQFDERLEALVKSQQDLLRRIDDTHARMADISDKVAASLNVANQTAIASSAASDLEKKQWFDTMTDLKRQNEEQLRTLTEEYKEVSGAIKTYLENQAGSNSALAAVFEQLRQELGLRTDRAPVVFPADVENVYERPVIQADINTDWQAFSDTLGTEVTKLLRQSMDTVVSTVVKPMVQTMQSSLKAHDSAFQEALERLMNNHDVRAEELSDNDRSLTKAMIESFEKSLDTFIDKNKTLFGQSTENLKDIKEKLLQTASSAAESVTIMASTIEQSASEAKMHRDNLLESINTLRNDIVRINQQTSAMNVQLQEMANTPVTVHLDDEALRCLTGINVDARCDHRDLDCDECIFADEADDRGQAATDALDAAYGPDVADHQENPSEFVLPPMPMPPTIDITPRSREDRSRSGSSSSSDEGDRDVTEAVEIAKRLVEKEKRKREHERLKRHRERRKMEQAYLKTMQEYQNTLRKHFDDLRAAYKEKCKLVMRSQNVLPHPAQRGRAGRRGVGTRGTRGCHYAPPRGGGGSHGNGGGDAWGGGHQWTSSRGRATGLAGYRGLRPRGTGNYGAHVSGPPSEGHSVGPFVGGGNLSPGTFDASGESAFQRVDGVQPTRHGDSSHGVDSMDDSTSPENYTPTYEANLASQQHMQQLQYRDLQHQQQLREQGQLVPQPHLYQQQQQQQQIMQAYGGGPNAVIPGGAAGGSRLHWTPLGDGFASSLHTNFQDMANFSRVGRSNEPFVALARVHQSGSGGSLPSSTQKPVLGTSPSVSGQHFTSLQGAREVTGGAPSVPALLPHPTQENQETPSSSSAQYMKDPKSYSACGVVIPGIVCDVQLHGDDVSEDVEKHKKTQPHSDTSTPPKHYVEPRSTSSGAAATGTLRKKARGRRRRSANKTQTEALGQQNATPSSNTTEDVVPQESLPERPVTPRSPQSMALVPVVKPGVFPTDEGGASALFSRRSRRLGNASAVVRAEAIALPAPNPDTPSVERSREESLPPSRSEMVSSDEPRAQTDETPPVGGIEQKYHVESSDIPRTKRKRSGDSVRADEDIETDAADDWNTALLWDETRGTTEVLLENYLDKRASPASPSPIDSGGPDAAANSMETSDRVGPEQTLPPSPLWLDDGACGVAPGDRDSPPLLYLEPSLCGDVYPCVSEDAMYDRVRSVSEIEFVDSRAVFPLQRGDYSTSDETTMDETESACADAPQTQMTPYAEFTHDGTSAPDHPHAESTISNAHISLEPLHPPFVPRPSPSPETISHPPGLVGDGGEREDVTTTMQFCSALPGAIPLGFSDAWDKPPTPDPNPPVVEKKDDLAPVQGSAPSSNVIGEASLRESPKPPERTHDSVTETEDDLRTTPVPASLADTTAYYSPDSRSFSSSSSSSSFESTHSRITAEEKPRDGLLLPPTPRGGEERIGSPPGVEGDEEGRALAHQSHPAIDALSPDPPPSRSAGDVISPPKESTREDHTLDEVEKTVDRAGTAPVSAAAIDVHPTTIAATAASALPPISPSQSPHTVQSRLRHEVPHTRVLRSPSPTEQQEPMTPSTGSAVGSFASSSGNRAWYARLQARVPLEVVKKRKSRKKINFGTAVKPLGGERLRRRSHRARSRGISEDGEGEEEVNPTHFVPPFASTPVRSTAGGDVGTGPLASLGGIFGGAVSEEGGANASATDVFLSSSETAIGVGQIPAPSAPPTPIPSSSRGELVVSAEKKEREGENEKEKNTRIKDHDDKVVITPTEKERSDAKVAKTEEITGVWELSDDDDDDWQQQRASPAEGNEGTAAASIDASKRFTNVSDLLEFVGNALATDHNQKTALCNFILQHITNDYLNDGECVVTAANAIQVITQRDIEMYMHAAEKLKHELEELKKTCAAAQQQQQPRGQCAGGVEDDDGECLTAPATAPPQSSNTLTLLQAHGGTEGVATLLPVPHGPPASAAVPLEVTKADADIVGGGVSVQQTDSVYANVLNYQKAFLSRCAAIRNMFSMHLEENPNDVVTNEFATYYDKMIESVRSAVEENKISEHFSAPVLQMYYDDRNVAPAVSSSDSYSESALSAGNARALVASEYLCGGVVDGPPNFDEPAVDVSDTEDPMSGGNVVYNFSLGGQTPTNHAVAPAVHRAPGCPARAGGGDNFAPTFPAVYYVSPAAVNCAVYFAGIRGEPFRLIPVMRALNVIPRRFLVQNTGLVRVDRLLAVIDRFTGRNSPATELAASLMINSVAKMVNAMRVAYRRGIINTDKNKFATALRVDAEAMWRSVNDAHDRPVELPATADVVAKAREVVAKTTKTLDGGSAGPQSMLVDTAEAVMAAATALHDNLVHIRGLRDAGASAVAAPKPNPFDMLLTLMLEDWGYRHDVRAQARERAFESTPSKDVENRSVFHSLITATKAMSRFAYNPQSAPYMVLLLNRLQRLWNVQMFAVPKRERTTTSYSFRKFVDAVWKIMFDSHSDADFADRYVGSVTGGNEMCHLVCETAFAMWDSINMHANQYPSTDNKSSAATRHQENDDAGVAMEVVEETTGRRPVAELNPLLFVADLLPVRIPYADASAVLDVAYALQPFVGDDAYRLFAVAKLCARADSIVASAPCAPAMRAHKRLDVFRAMWDLTMNGIDDHDEMNGGGGLVPGGEGAAGMAAACAALGLRDDMAEQLIGVALEVRSALNFSVVLAQDNLYLKVSRVYAAYGHDTRYGFLPVHVRAVIDDLNYMSMFAAGARVNHKHVVSEAWRVAVDADYSRQLASDANIWNWKVFAPGPDTSPEDLQKHEAVVAMLQRSPAYAAKVQTAARVYALFKREAFVRTIRRIRNTMSVTKSAVQTFLKKNDHPGRLVSDVQELVAHVAKTAKAYCDAESSFRQFFHVGEDEDEGEADVAMDVEGASYTVDDGDGEEDEESRSVVRERERLRRAKLRSEKEKRRNRLRVLATDMYRDFERFLHLMGEANESLVRCRGVHVVALQEEIRHVLSARFHSTERLVAHINAVRKLVAETDYPEVDRQNVRFLLRNAWCMTGHAKGDTEYMYYLTQAMMYLPLSGRGADAHSIVCSYQTVVENIRRNRKDAAAATNYDNPILDAFDYYVAGDANGYLPCEFYASASTVDMVAAYYRDGHHCQMMRFLLRYFAGLVHLHTEKRYNYGVVYALEQKGELLSVNDRDGGGGGGGNQYLISRDVIDAMPNVQLRPLGVEHIFFGGDGDDGVDAGVVAGGTASGATRKRKHAGETADASGAGEKCTDKNFAHPAMLPVTYPLENTRDPSVTDFSLPMLTNAYYFDNDKFLELYLLACSYPDSCRMFVSEETRARAKRTWSSVAVQLPPIHRTSSANAANAPTSLQVIMLTDFMGQLMKSLRRACDVPVVAYLVNEVAAGRIPLDAVMRSAWRHYWLVNHMRARTTMKAIAAFARDGAFRANALKGVTGESWDDHVYHIFRAVHAINVEPVVLDRFMVRCDPAVLSVPQDVFTRTRHAVFVRIAAELSGEKMKKFYRVENKCIQEAPIVAPRFFAGVPKKAPSPSPSSYPLSATAMAALMSSHVAMNVFVEHYTVVYEVLQNSFETKMLNALQSADEAFAKRDEMYERVEAMRSRTYSDDEWNKFVIDFGAYLPTDMPELMEKFRADVEEMHSFVTRKEQRQIIYERCMARYDDSAAHCADFAAVDSAVSMPHRVMRDARNYFGIHSRDAATGRTQQFVSSMKTNIVALNRLLVAKLTLAIGSYVSLESIYALVDAIDLVNRAYIVSALNEEATEDSMARMRRMAFVSTLANMLRYCTPAFVREIVLTNERRVSSLGTVLSWEDYMDFMSNARDIMLEYFLMDRDALAKDIAPLVEQIKRLPPEYLVPRFADRCNELIVSKQMQDQILLTMKQFDSKYGRHDISVVQAALIDDDGEEEPPESDSGIGKHEEGRLGDEDDPFVSALPTVADDEAFATFLRDVRAKFARARMDAKQPMECDDEAARTGTKRSWGHVGETQPPLPATPPTDCPVMGGDEKGATHSSRTTTPPPSASALPSTDERKGGEASTKKDADHHGTMDTEASVASTAVTKPASTPPRHHEVRTSAERTGGISERKRRVKDQHRRSKSTDDSDDDGKRAVPTTKKRVESRVLTGHGKVVGKFEAILRRPVDPQDRTALAKLVLESARVCYLDVAVDSNQQSVMSGLLCEVLTTTYLVPAIGDACARWPRRNRQWMDWIPEVFTKRLFSHLFFVDNGAHENDTNEASYLESVTRSITSLVQSPGYHGVGVNDAGVLDELVKFLSELFSHKFPRADAKLLIEFQSPLDSLSLPRSIEFGTLSEYFSYANRCRVTDDAVSMFAAFAKVYPQCVVDALAGGDASRPLPALFGPEMRVFIEATYNDGDRANCPAVSWCHARCAPAGGVKREENAQEEEYARVSAPLIERRKRPFASFVDYQKRYTRFECSKFFACATVLHDPLPPDETFVSPFESDCYDVNVPSPPVSLSKELRTMPMAQIRRASSVQSFYALAPISGSTGLVPRFDHIRPTQGHARDLPVKPWETYRENMLRAAINNLTLYPFRDVVGSHIVPHATTIESASQPSGWSTCAICDTGGVFNVQIRFRQHGVSASHSSSPAAAVGRVVETDNVLHVYFTISTEYVSRGDHEPVCYRGVLDGSQQFSFNWLDCVCYELQYVYERYAPVEYPHQVVTRSMCLLFKWASVLTTFTSSVKSSAHAFGSVCGVVASFSKDVASNASSNEDFEVRFMKTTTPVAASKSRLVYNPYAMVGVGVNDRGCFSSPFHYPFTYRDVDLIPPVNVRSALSAIDFDFSWFRNACSKHVAEYRSHTAEVATAYLNEMVVTPTGTAAVAPHSSQGSTSSSSFSSNSSFSDSSPSWLTVSTDVWTQRLLHVPAKEFRAMNPECASVQYETRVPHGFTLIHNRQFWSTYLRKSHEIVSVTVDECEQFFVSPECQDMRVDVLPYTAEHAYMTVADHCGDAIRHGRYNVVSDVVTTPANEGLRNKVEEHAKNRAEDTLPQLRTHAFLAHHDSACITQSLLETQLDVDVGTLCRHIIAAGDDVVGDGASAAGSVGTTKNFRVGDECLWIGTRLSAFVREMMMYPDDGTMPYLTIACASPSAVETAYKTFVAMPMAPLTALTHRKSSNDDEEMDETSPETSVGSLRRKCDGDALVRLGLYELVAQILSESQSKFSYADVGAYASRLTEYEYRRNSGGAKETMSSTSLTVGHLLVLFHHVMGQHAEAARLSSIVAASSSTGSRRPDDEALILAIDAAREGMCTHALWKFLAFGSLRRQTVLFHATVSVQTGRRRRESDELPTPTTPSKAYRYGMLDFNKPPPPATTSPRHPIRDSTTSPARPRVAADSPRLLSRQRLPYEMRPAARKYSHGGETSARATKVGEDTSSSGSSDGSDA